MRLLIAAAVAALALPALAQPPRPQSSLAQATAAAPPSGAAGPGGMTLQQLQNERWALLSMLDTDKDGRVSRAEWDAVSAIAPGQLTPAVWERLDANKDGYVARDEVNARIAARFALMDTNHDNLVSPEEMKALQAEAMRQPQAAQSATPPAPAPAPKPPAGPPPK